ncbi:MAG: alkaline phosphatase family protein [Pirellulaceae bacterium]
MTTQNGLAPRQVLLVELNEITWRLLQPLLDQQALPALADLLRRGVRATAIAPEVSPDLDPWISWTTLYTGRPSAEHGVKFLEQPPETVQGPRIWDIAADAGKSLGLFGSIMSWPPRQDFRGFWVPGTFSPDEATYPASLQPIQELNLTYTRAHSPLAAGQRRSSKLSLLWKLRRLGLKLSTLGEIASFFARRAAGRAHEWEKVSLQPLLNLDFFEALWTEHRPDFATFHTNHVAHYQHRYWRSTDPTPFLEQPSADESRKYGGAIRFGYKSADRLVRRLQRLVGPETVLVVASGLGQQPYVSKEFREGRTVVRLQEIEQLLDLLGVRGQCEPYSVMAPQWNVRFRTAEARERAARGLAAAYYGAADQPLLSHLVAGDTICLNVCQKLPRPIDWDTPCVFPETGQTISMRQLCAEKDPTPKQGYHEAAGVFMMAGPGIRAGVDLHECSTLDLAPTMLHLMGLPIPDHMPGRVLEEALETPPARHRKESVLEPAGVQHS